MNPRETDLSDKALAVLLGSALGDALGATVEFMSPSEIMMKHGVHNRIRGGGWLYLKPGQVTDDTQMSLCIARSLARNGKFVLEDIAREFSKWLRGNPVDAGATCVQGIRLYINLGTTCVKPSRWHAGNGALMRNAPVALATYGDDARLSSWSLGQAHLTHNHPLSDMGCLLAGRMIHSALAGGSLRELKEIADAGVMKAPEFSYEPYPGKTTGYVADTLATVFHCLFTTSTFEECLVKTVNLGGDGDTTGCIAGGIAGALYGTRGLPRKWLSKLDRKVREEIDMLAGKLMRLAVPHEPPNEMEKLKGEI